MVANAAVVFLQSNFLTYNVYSKFFSQLLLLLTLVPVQVLHVSSHSSFWCCLLLDHVTGSSYFTTNYFFYSCKCCCSALDCVGNFAVIFLALLTSREVSSLSLSILKYLSIRF